MADEERIVTRFNDGRVLKGYTKGFTAVSDFILLDEAGSGKEHVLLLPTLRRSSLSSPSRATKPIEKKKPSDSVPMMDIRCTSNSMTRSLLWASSKGKFLGIRVFLYPETAARQKASS